MNKLTWTIPLLVAAAILGELISDALGYQIEWTAVGICLTAIIAVWQLRQDSAQKAADRELETKRDILFEGVRGMTQAMQAFASLPNMGIDFSETMKHFQSGMTAINVATSVASLPAAKAGKEFIDKLGPLFMRGMKIRMDLDRVQEDDDTSVAENHRVLVAHCLDNTLDLGKAMLRAIAAVRTDVGIAKESEAEFLAVVYPNEALVRGVINEVLGRQ